MTGQEALEPLVAGFEGAALDESCVWRKSEHGRNTQPVEVAEREGFEPSMGCPIRHFQCRALGL